MDPPWLSMLVSKIVKNLSLYTLSFRTVYNNDGNASIIFTFTVTGLSLWGSVVAVGLVCIFYTTLVSFATLAFKISEFEYR